MDYSKLSKEELIDLLNKKDEKCKFEDIALNKMNSGYALHKIIYNEKNEPIDYIFFKVNRAFEKLTGLKEKDVIGKSIKEVLPNIENYWIEIYNRVIESGQSYKFENFSIDLNRYYEVEVISPQKYYFITIFQDITKKVKIQKDLLELKNRYEAMFSNMSNCVAVYKAVDNGEDFVFVDFNKSAEIEENVKKEDVLGKRVTEVFSGVVEFGLMDVFKRVYKSEKAEYFPISFYYDKRISGWRDNFVYKLPNGEIVAIYQNRTKEKQVEDSLRKSEAILAKAQKISKMGSWEWDLTNNRIWGSREFYNIFEIDFIDTFINADRILEKIHPNDINNIVKIMEKAVNEKRDFTINHKIILSNKKERVIHTEGKLEFNELNEVIKMVGITQDITEKYLLEQKHKELHTQYKAIFDFSPFSIILIDGDGNIIKANRAFADIRGYSVDELEKMNIKDFTLEDEKCELFETINKIFNSELDFVKLEKKCLTRDKRLIYTRGTLSSIKDTNGDVKFGLLIFEDITDEIKLKQEKEEKEMLLIQQSKMAVMGEMIGAIGHQWKQPLNILSSGIANLQIKSSFGELSEDLLEEFIEISNKQIQFMANTIDDFRNFFKPTKRKEVFNPKEAIEDIINILMPQFKNNTIDISINSINDNISILGFPNEFKQVVLNIINNAKDAILEKRKRGEYKENEYGKVTIDLIQKNKKVIIDIFNDANKIKDENLSHIFESYFTTKGKKGTGIGLYISKNIIENNFNGKIYAKNSENGVNFIIEVDYEDR